MKIKLPKLNKPKLPNLKQVFKSIWTSRPQLSVSRIQALYLKEMTSFVYSPASYVIIIVFLIVAYILFFGNFFSLGLANLDALFDILPWLILLVAAALGMNSLASERKEGTFEYLLTQPIQIGELLLGKYLALLSQVAICILATLPLAVGVSTLGKMDAGVVFAQYLAASMVAAILSAIALCVSSLVKNQIAAFLGSMLLSFALLFVGTELFTRNVPLLIASNMESLSLLSHYMSMARGAIDLRDLLYGFVLVGLFLLLTRLAILNYKYPMQSRVVKQSRLLAIALIVVCLAIGLIGEFIPGRIDLTSGGIYTISKATTEILQKLPGATEINIYLSPDLPPQFQPQIRDIRNLVREYQLLGGSNLVANYKYVDNADLKSEATAAGIQETQFNVVGNNELQVKSGFLGIQLKYKEVSEVIPFVEDTDKLEYEITSRIAKLTNESKTKVLVMAPTDSQTGAPLFSLFIAELQKTLAVENFTFGEDSKIPSDASLLIILGLDQPLVDAQIKAIKDYFLAGGRIMLAQNSVEVVPTSTEISASESQLTLRTLFEDMGVKISSELAYDLQSHETVATTNNGARTLARYPFWLLAKPSSELALTQQIDAILLPWASQLEVADKLPEGVSVTKVLATTDYASTQTKENFNVGVNAPFNEEGLKNLSLMVEITKNLADNKQAKALVMGDSDWLNDQFIDYKQNLGFALKSVEWLTQANSLAEIKVKNRTGARITSNDSSFLKYGVPIITIGATVVSAYLLISKRKRREHDEWVAISA